MCALAKEREFKKKFIPKNEQTIFFFTWDPYFPLYNPFKNVAKKIEKFSAFIVSNNEIQKILLKNITIYNEADGELNSCAKKLKSI